MLFLFFFCMTPDSQVSQKVYISTCTTLHASMTPSDWQDAKIQEVTNYVHVYYVNIYSLLVYVTVTSIHK